MNSVVNGHNEPEKLSRSRGARSKKGSGRSRSVWLLFFTAVLAWQTLYGGIPLKLLLEDEGVWTDDVDARRIKVRLVDASGDPTSLRDPLDLTITMEGPSGAVSATTVEMPAASNSVSFRLEAADAGLYKVSADHEWLLGGSLLFKTLPAEDKSSVETRGEGKNGYLGMLQGQRLKVLLRYTPERKLLADGVDSATVYAIIADDSIRPDRDVKIRLHNSDGILDPNPLTIPEGETTGVAKLRSENVGAVTLEYLTSDPPVRVDGSGQMTVGFAPPITRLDLKISPSSITLAEAVTVIARFVDSSGKPLTTDTPRKISFFLNQGSGEWSSAETTVPAGEAEARVSFLPHGYGNFVLGGSTPAMIPATGTLSVTLPYLAIAIAALGGLAGGGVAFLYEKDARWWRLPVGVFTGLLAYALTLAGLMWVDIAVGASSPISAFVAGSVGGWAGSGLLQWLSRRLGLMS